MTKKETYQSSLDDEDDLENDFHSINPKKGTGIFQSSTPRKIDYQPLQIDRNKNSSSSSPASAVDPIAEPDTCSEQFKKKIRHGNAVYSCLVLPLIIIIIILSIIIATPKHIESQSTSTNIDPQSTDPWEQFRVTSTKGAVATDIQVCSQIGVNVLMQGGNAIDAAIAAKLCLSVVSPASSGVGGGCYMLIHNATEKEQYFIDAREVAPSLAFPTMFKDNPIKAQDGGLAIAVLGEIKGLYLAYEKFGSKKVSWSSLVLPAAILAKEWIITPQIHKLLYMVEKQLFSGKYPLLSGLYLKKDSNGNLVMKDAGDIVQQPELSYTLEMISQYGPDYLYTIMAETLANEIQSAGGIITKEDIMNYQPILTKPIKATFHGYQYIGVGGSSSGGPIVIAILKYMSSISQPLTSLHKNLYFHYLVECMKHVFAIRTNLGDPDYVNVTNIYSALQSDSYMTYLQEYLTNEDHTLPILNYGGKYNLEYLSKDDHGTTHLSVIDADGNAIGMTSTINTYFGSKVISPSTGILFNNQMDDFAIPGSSNYFGLAPSPYNYPEPGKKPLSSMSPSIVLDHRSNVRLIGGASGGPKIITATAQVILNVIELGMNILDAVRSPRVHCQLLPDSIDVENATLVSGLHISMPSSIAASLTARGHHNASLVNVGMGVTQFISFDPETGIIEAVSDPRKDGKPAALK